MSNGKTETTEVVESLFGVGLDRLNTAAFLAGLGERIPRVFDVHENGDEIVKAVIFGNGKEPVLDAYKKPMPKKDHEFDTLQGFLDYLNSDHCGNTDSIVFVGEKVVANLAYNSHIVHRATLQLEPSEEYRALETLMNFSTQKDVWRTMYTGLSGCIEPDNLFVLFHNLKSEKSDSTNIRIDSLGLTSGSAERNISIVVPNSNGGESKQSLPQECRWTGKLWDCFDQTASIDLLIEADIIKDELCFCFHPKRLREVVNDMRLLLAARIREAVPKDKFTVHEGTI